MADTGSDIAHTLADALQKIENILADDRNQDHIHDEDIHNSSHLYSKISNYAQGLRECIETADSTYLENHINIPSDTTTILLKWLHAIQPKSSLDHNYDLTDQANCRQKVLRLENEKDSLLVQVGVLTDQVEVQGEKIRDLEFTKDELQIKLADIQEQLSEAEKQVCQSKNQCAFLKDEVSESRQMFEKEKQKIDEQEPGISTEVNELKREIAKRDMEIEDLRTHLETLLDEEERQKRLSSSSDSGNLGLKTQLREKASEVSRLKIKLEKLTALLDEKEKYIEELKRQQVIPVTNNDDAKSDRSVNELNDEIFFGQHKTNQDKRSNKEEPSVSGIESRNEAETTFRDNAGKAPTSRPNSSPLQNNVIHGNHNSPLKRDTQNKSRSSFGKGFLKLKKSRSQSEPNLSPTEGDEADEHNDKTSHQGHEKEKKRNIVGKVFGKLRRSNSQGLDAELKSHTSNGQARTLHSDVPFSSWSAEMVASWLEDECLGQYADACTNYIQTGDDLVKMSTTDLEKVFGMKKILHRKKLHLALQAITDQTSDVTEHLDNNWVLDWLDDIGLPQYKDPFRENLVDGRMLNYLTVPPFLGYFGISDGLGKKAETSDALQLKVYSTFHQHSLRRAIQCLRIHNFHPNYLKKSPIDESWQKGAHVVLWTNHRITEWLRQADLSEYATNLRGSGVHGSLMILEPRFTAESLATLLSIPVGKKLLRRHLATHFESLVGQACMKVKEAALTNGMSPLLPGEKHKAIKKSLSIKKRTKSDAECEEYVCPMDTEVPLALQRIFASRLRKNDGVTSGNVGEQKNKGPKGNDELTRSLGTFSKELNSLTDMLGQETSNEK